MKSPQVAVNHVLCAPHVATVEQIRDYLDWMVQTGKGQYHLEVRQRMAAIPPEGDTHSDAEQLVFLRGIY